MFSLFEKNEWLTKKHQHTKKKPGSKIETARVHDKVEVLGMQNEKSLDPRETNPQPPGPVRKQWAQKDL